MALEKLHLLLTQFSHFQLKIIRSNFEKILEKKYVVNKRLVLNKVFEDSGLNDSIGPVERELASQDPTFVNKLFDEALYGHLLIKSQTKDVNPKSKLIKTNPLDAIHGISETHEHYLKLIARTKRELLFLGYRSGYQNELAIIRKKIKDKVRFRIVGELEFVEDFSEYLKDTSGNVKYYYFIKEQVEKILGENEAKYAKFHAKVIVSDDKHGIISSANLTYSGFNCNIEIGTVLDANEVLEVKRFMRELIKNKIIKEYRVYT